MEEREVASRPRKTTQSSHGPRFNAHRHNLWHKFLNQAHYDQNQANPNSGRTLWSLMLDNWSNLKLSAYMLKPYFQRSEFSSPTLIINFWQKIWQRLKKKTDSRSHCCQGSHQFYHSCKCWVLIPFHYLSELKASSLLKILWGTGIPWIEYTKSILCQKCYLDEEEGGRDESSWWIKSIVGSRRPNSSILASCPSSIRLLA